MRNLLLRINLSIALAASLEKAGHKDPEKGMHGCGVELVMHCKKRHQYLQCAGLTVAWIG